MTDRRDSGRPGRPRDAREGPGPLWCLPAAAGLVAAWLDGEERIEALTGERGGLSIIGRYRLERDGAPLDFILCQNSGLRDGAACRVRLSDSPADLPESSVAVRLAAWNARQSGPVANALMGAVFERLGSSADPAPFERYLSLVADWRLAGRVLARLGEQTLLELDMPASLLSGTEMACLFFDPAPARRVAQVLPVDGTRSLALLPSPLMAPAYADLGDAVVELDITWPDHEAAENLSWAQTLPPATRDRLLDLLEKTASPPTRLSASLARALAPVRAAAREARFTVQGCFHAGDRLVAFLKADREARWERVSLAPFGAAPLEECLLLPLGDGRKAVALASIEGDPPHLCRVAAQQDGEQRRAWAPVLPSGAQALALCRDHGPNASFDDRYLNEVAGPLALAWTQGPEGPRGSFRTATPGSESDFTLAVLCEEGLDDLFRTLDALTESRSLSQSAGLKIILAGRSDPEPDCSAIRRWADDRAVSADVHWTPSRTAPGHGLRAALAPGGPAILVKAGFTPPEASWLSEPAALLRAEPATIALGSGAPGLHPEKASLLLGGEAPGAAAFGAKALARMLAAQPRCHTFNGIVAEWLVCGADLGFKARRLDALRFEGPSMIQGARSFTERLDETLIRGMVKDAVMPRLAKTLTMLNDTSRMGAKAQAPQTDPAFHLSSDHRRTAPAGQPHGSREP